MTSTHQNDVTMISVVDVRVEYAHIERQIVSALMELL
jgi:hypothetical protein